MADRYPPLNPIPPRRFSHPPGCNCCECRPAREDPWQKGIEQAEEKEREKERQSYPQR